jgi:mono/diheme cytochrome c family protein
MNLIVKLVGVLFLVVVVIAGTLLAYARATGLQSHGNPGPLETRVARAIRSVATPPAEKLRANPLAASNEAAAEGLQHFARYCALCHGNDGSGQKTPLGSGLFPKPPDLRGQDTQQLTDGELFYIIENGVRFTGMPAFGTGVRSEAGERQTWQLVTFIRKIPSLTTNEIGWMESLNPL